MDAIKLSIEKNTCKSRERTKCSIYILWNPLFWYILHNYTHHAALPAAKNASATATQRILQEKLIHTPEKQSNLSLFL